MANRRLYRVILSHSIQGVTVTSGDYGVYNPDTQRMSLYVSGDTLNPPPVALPEVMLKSLVESGHLELTPQPQIP